MATGDGSRTRAGIQPWPSKEERKSALRFGFRRLLFISPPAQNDRQHPEQSRMSSGSHPIDSQDAHRQFNWPATIVGESSLSGTSGMNEAQQIASGTRFSRVAWLTAVLPILAVLNLVVRPVSNDDFWWHLSRGRTVLEGHFSPSHVLLTGEKLNDADWLGGVPFYLVFQVAGISGLMLLKFTAAIGLSVWCWRLGRQTTRSVQILSLLGLALLSLSACEPSPALWDVLGLVLAGNIVSRAHDKPTSSQLFFWGLLAWAWANLGVLPILILLPLMTFRVRCKRGEDSAPKFSPGIVSLWIIAVLALCVTPRGIWTIGDAIRELAPILFISRDVLQETDWRPVFSGPVDQIALGWGLLGGLGVMGLIRSGTVCFAECLTFVTLFSIGSWTRTTAVVMSVWLIRWNLETWSTSDSSMRIHDVKFAFERMAFWMSEVLCLVVLVDSTVGRWPFEGARTGWGLNRRLEIRLLIESLEHKRISFQPVKPSTVPHGTAHCTDIRAAGMLVWSKVSRSKPFLVPRRALLNGKLGDEILLNRELRTGWLKSHRRSDGTEGGWWLTLRQRNTMLLLTSAERISLIRGLEPTIWKPLSLDSPVIAYALAGYPTYTSRIAEIAMQREFVDRDNWAFQPEPAAGNDQLWDVVGTFTGWSDPDPILRQAGILRGMNLAVAAQRVLRPLLQTTSLQRLSKDTRLRNELVACQLDLAEREQFVTGRISEFRQRALLALSAEAQLPHWKMHDASAGVATNDPQITEQLTQAVFHYLAGDPHGAADLLQADHPDIMQARAMLEQESGSSDKARELWRLLSQRYPDSRAALASQSATRDEY